MVKWALHERAAEIVVLASYEKLGAASPFGVAQLSELAALVVPPRTPVKMIRAFRKTGLNAIVAK